MPLIYLLRHEKPENPAGRKRCLGWTDPPLGAEGLQGALALAAYFAGKRLALVYHSGLERSRATAAALAGKALPLAAEPRLREINMGEWDGLYFDDLRRQFPEAWAWRGQNLATRPAPGGESFADCAARAVPAFKALAEREGQDIAVVAHAGVNRCILSEFLGRDLNSLLELPQDYGCVNIIEREGEKYTVLEINLRC